MSSSSLKTNFLLNLLNTVTGLLFPLITFPYASRILLAEGIGQVQFFQSIIDYVALFAALGIPLYAVREVAKIRDDIQERSKITSEILLLHTLLTICAYVCIFILVTYVTKIKINSSLFLLLSTTLFFNAIGVPWFYQAVEDFKYITIRAITIRLLSLIALFLLVKSKNDLMYYAAITVIANVGANIFNFYRLRKYLSYTIIANYRELQFKRHLKPAMQIFILNLIVSIYINLDSVMLGFLKDQQAVGYYAGATKLTKAVIGVITSLGVVLLPRFSNMIGNGLIDEFYSLANKAISFVFALSFPMFIGLTVMAAPIIHLFCGPDFEPSVLTLQFISPIVLFISLSGIIGMQILYPLGKEKLVILSTLIGAILNFVLNLILIPQFSQFGSAIATSIAEASVLVTMIILGRKSLLFSWLSHQNFNYFLGSILILVFLFLIKYVFDDELVFLLVGILGSCIIYGIFLFIKKDPIILRIMDLLSNMKLNKLSR